MPKAYAVRIHDRGKLQYILAEDQVFIEDEAVIIETEFGEEYGICTGKVIDVPECACEKFPLEKFLRVADEFDTKRYYENIELEKQAKQICQEFIEKHELPMNLTGVEYLLDHRRIIFYFTADGRVDFRELVKDLAATFHTRIELRQIGVRDEARMKGGLGICGRELCCCTFLNNFEPVSIKMAKEQNLSMNPGKISGACGRLLCCLKYEQEAYEDANRRLPSKGDKVSTPQGVGQILDVNLLKESLLIRLEDENVSDPVTILAKDVRILTSRSAKGKKEQAAQENNDEEFAEEGDE